MDVKTAFLNGKLDEDVFMAQPEGFVDPKYPDRVCKLERSIYGLKQASCSWNLCFLEKVKEFVFHDVKMSPAYMLRPVGVMFYSSSFMSMIYCS